MPGIKGTPEKVTGKILKLKCIECGVKFKHIVICKVRRGPELCEECKYERVLVRNRLRMRRRNGCKIQG